MKSLAFVFGTALLATPVLSHGQAEEKVTAETLPKLLSGLGYEPTKVDQAIQRITIERDKFTFRLNFSVSGNTKKVWMSTYLVELPDLSKVPAKSLADALLTNSEIGPAHFYLAKVGEKVWLKMGFALDNRNITPAYLRGEIDWFLERLAEKAPVWDKAKWVPTP
ncbi:hypothetical protein EON82_10050 [bacterium]|nr:MAG: hypothetical protein EON82_10050 [bacterium]